MIEAELKAEVTSLDIKSLKSKLVKLDAKPKHHIYSDIYFTKDSIFDSSEQELRLRTILYEDKSEKHFLTYKSKPLDAESKSKEEIEVNISDSIKMQEILLSLGLIIKVKFQKTCENYKTYQYGKEFLITLVSFSEIESKYIEIETLIVNQNQLNSSLVQIKQIFTSLKIPLKLITNQYYTDLFLPLK